MSPERERLRLLEAVTAAAGHVTNMVAAAPFEVRLGILGAALSALRAHDASTASGQAQVGETVERKIVQVSTAFDRGDGFGENGSSYHPAMVTTALCSDGTLWWKHHHESPWVQHQPIPARVPLPVVPVIAADVEESR